MHSILQHIPLCVNEFSDIESQNNTRTIKINTVLFRHWVCKNYILRYWDESEAVCDESWMTFKWRHNYVKSYIILSPYRFLWKEDDKDSVVPKLNPILKQKKRTVVPKFNSLFKEYWGWTVANHQFLKCKQNHIQNDKHSILSMSRIKNMNIVSSFSWSICKILYFSLIFSILF